MLETLRKWGRKARPSNAQSKADHTRQAMEGSRERRAQSVDALRGEIDRIQHEISDLNNVMTREAGAVTEAQRSKMATLHRELASVQLELGKYQARI